MVQKGSNSAVFQFSDGIDNSLIQKDSLISFHEDNCNGVQPAIIANGLEDSLIELKINNGVSEQGTSFHDYDTNSVSIALIIKTNNTPPIANAGDDQTVTVGDTVYFDGSGSSDSDGNITAYEWKNGATIVSTNVSFSSNDLDVGTHTITLTVTDDKNATASDDVVITVNEAPPPPKTEKNVADGYLIKLSSPAVAYCGNNEYSSSLNIGEKGKILFENISLPNDCNIFVPSGVTIDSNNNGVLDATDKKLNFSMKGSADGTFISPLTTLLLEKKAKGEDVTEFKAMVKDFDPVTCASEITNGTGTDKTKNQKLMLLMEVLKTAMKNPADANITDINLSSIIKTNVSENIDDFNIDALTSGFGSSLQSLIWDKASKIKKLINTFDDLDPTKIDINSLYINFSDQGKEIEDAIRDSLKVTVGATANLLEAIGKPDVNLTAVLDNFTSMNSGTLSSMGKPIAKAGADITVFEGEDVNLSGLASFDINGHIVSYEWKEGNTTLSSDSNFSKNDFSLGSHELTLRVRDDDNLTNSDNIVVVITPAPIVNQMPIANGQSITTEEDTSVDINLTGSDNEGSPLSYIIESNTTHGTLSGIAPNLTYTPNENYFGIDIFTFRVNDGSLDSTIATVEINITAVNDMPIAYEQNITTMEDTPLDMNLTGSDREGSLLTYIVVDNPSHGVLSGTAPSLTYTPTTDYNGNDSFTFKVNDGLVDSEIVAVNINVVNINDVPIANGQSIATEEDTSVDINLTGSDNEGSPLSYIIESNTTHGTLSGTAPNLTYTPNENYFGIDIFTFRVNDGSIDSTIATVEINITSVNDIPIANAGADQTQIEGNMLILEASNSTDPDGNIIAYQWQEAGVILGNDINLTKSDFSVGVHTITLTVTDDKNASASDDVVVTITEKPNQAPIANAGLNQTVTLGTAVTLDASGSSDSDGNITSYEWKEGNITLSNEINFTKSNFKIGIHTITLNVIDNKGAIGTDEVLVTVREIADSNTSMKIFTLKKTAQSISYKQYDDGDYENGIPFNYTKEGEDILDRITSLVWQDNSETNNSTKNWNDAKNYCEALTGAWRLPTREELSGLIRYDKYSPSIDGIFKQTASNYYWTDDVSQRDSNNAWAVSFSEGLETAIEKTANYYVRCVKEIGSIVANAGEDQIVEEGNIVTLYGGYSLKSTNIVLYKWSENQETLGEGKLLEVSTLHSGEHNITLTMKDIDGNIDTDIMKVTITSDNRVLKKTSQSISYIQYDDGNYEKGIALNYVQKGENILDRATGLLWKNNEDSNGSKKSWQEANNYCSSLSGNWRLPTRKELAGLLRYDRVSPAIDKIFSYTLSDYYWTLDTSNRDNDQAWVVSFDEGIENTANKKSNSYSTRCVGSDFVFTANAGSDQFIEQDDNITLSANDTPRKENVESYSWVENGIELGRGRVLVLFNTNDIEHHISLIITDKNGTQDIDDVVVTTVASDKVLKKTGQTISYKQYDDGYYEKGMTLNYTRKDANILDRTTGLLWQDANGTTNGDTRSWEEANNYCSTLGDGNWRLPTRLELSGLLRYDNVNPSISSIFAYTTSDYYWTINTSNRDNDKAWVVSFSEGVETTLAKSDSYSTRCVYSSFLLTANAGEDQLIEDGTSSITLNAGNSPRQAVINSYRWVENGVDLGYGEELEISDMFDGEHRISLIVTDSNGIEDSDEIVVSIVSNNKVLKKTGQTISYKAYDDGYYEKGMVLHYNQEGNNILDRTTALLWQNSPDTNGSKMLWEEAKNYCASLSGSWRLPSRKELAGLLRYDNVNPAISKIFTHTANDYYWTINTSTRDNDFAWAVSFSEGLESMISKKDSYSTRCVGANFRLTAHAGEDQLVEKDNNITLNAINTPRKERISSYSWSENGTVLGETALLTLDNITSGEHQIFLTVSDDDGNEDSDDVWVNIVANHTIIKKTGQITSYKDYDDGDYQKGETWNYVDNGNTVSDNTANLTWQDDSDTETLTKSWEDAKNYCANLEIDGAEWRLPTRLELSGLIDYGASDPSIESSFDNTISDYYWTIETSHQDNHNAWSISFSEGIESSNVKSSLYYIRCIKTQ
ncbi:Chitinase [hydrothermal vent metagenome]|uniref:Chitinase n=1 Tax=hydrothermal vent metagenome TaxID=652676 RepID=A0A1W1CZP8_9ZZZZ